MRHAFPLLALSLACAACDPPSPPQATPPAASTPTPPALPSASESAPSPPPVASAAPVGPRAPGPSASDLATLARSNNAFAFDLYARIRSQPGNLAIAPISLSTAADAVGAGYAVLEPLLRLVEAHVMHAG